MGSSIVTVPAVCGGNFMADVAATTHVTVSASVRSVAAFSAFSTLPSAESGEQTET